MAVSVLEQGALILEARRSALLQCAELLTAGDEEGASEEAELFGDIYEAITGKRLAQDVINKLLDRAAVLALFSAQEPAQ